MSLGDISRMKRLFEIDKLMAKSLTKQICDGYRAAIADGRLAGGERFPTCREICDEFGVSMIVSAAVVKQLGREGLIRSRPHSGSFVVPQESTAENLRPLSGWADLSKVPRPFLPQPLQPLPRCGI